MSFRVHHGGLEDVIACESVSAAQQAVPAAEAVTGDSNCRALTAGRCVPVRQPSLAFGGEVDVRHAVDVAPAAARLGEDGRRGRIEADGLQGTHIDDDTVLNEREPASMMTA